MMLKDVAYIYLKIAQLNLTAVYPLPTEDKQNIEILHYLSDKTLELPAFLLQK